MTLGLAYWIIILVLVVFGIALHMGYVGSRGRRGRQQAARVQGR